MPRRTITEAAIRHGGKVYTGQRHGVIMQQIWAGQETPAKILDKDQGFMTSDGHFVDRYIAGIIAYNAGQTKVEHHHLLSEHVW